MLFSLEQKKTASGKSITVNSCPVYNKQYITIVYKHID